MTRRLVSRFLTVVLRKRTNGVRRNWMTISVMRWARRLPVHRIFQYVFRVERLNGVEHFGLLVANFVRAERDGGFHRGHGEQLEEMVRHHVAEGASGLVKAAAVLDAHGF